MATSQVFSFPQTSIPTGTFTIPPTSLGASRISLTLSLARCTTPTPTVWPNATTTISVSLQGSKDNGLTYQDLGSFTSLGGIIADKHGAEIPQSTATWSLAGEDHVQGTIVVAGGPLVTSGSITVA